MKSIAIWYKHISNQEATIESVELHFNLWKLPNGTQEQIRFLDIGIKLKNTKNVEVLKLYFPCKIKEINFEDIVGNFIDSAELVSAIFNENYKVVTSSTSKLFPIFKADDKLVFNIYKTSTDDIKVEEKFTGTIFSISVPNQDDEIYFRFRVKGDFINSLSSTHSPTNAIFESAFSEIEMIDFRVNESRDLDLTLLEEIQKEQKLKISKMHFFFICSINEEVIGHHIPFNSCRNLENPRWKEYVGLPNIENQKFLAYHWKEKDIEDSNILIKTKYEKNNWKTIGWYLLVFFLISMAIELLGHGVYDLLKHLYHLI